MVIQTTNTAEPLVLAGKVIRHEPFILRVPSGGMVMRATYMLRRCVIGDIVGYIDYGDALELSIGQVTEESWERNPITGLQGHKYTILTVPRYNESSGHTDSTFYARVFCIFEILTQAEVQALNE